MNKLPQRLHIPVDLDDEMPYTLAVNLTDEGIIIDLVDGHGNVAGTRSEMYAEIADDLLGS